MSAVTAVRIKGLPNKAEKTHCCAFFAGLGVSEEEVHLLGQGEVSVANLHTHL